MFFHNATLPPLDCDINAGPCSDFPADLLCTERSFEPNQDSWCFKGKRSLKSIFKDAESCCTPSVKALSISSLKSGCIPQGWRNPTLFLSPKSLTIIARQTIHQYLPIMDKLPEWNVYRLIMEHLTAHHLLPDNQ